MRDFYPEDMVLRDAIFNSWRNSADRFGFQQYDSSVVETLELLERKAGEEIIKQIYAFEDKSGRRLALRPEMTPTLARMVAARQGELSFPIKWSAIAQCFRYERTTRGRKREHYQWNLDIIGEESVSAETEIIATAVDALNRLGLSNNDFKVYFNSRALLSELLARTGIEKKYHETIFLALDKRGKASDEEITGILTDAGFEQEAISRVFEILKISSLEDAEKILGETAPSLVNLRSFLQLIEAYGLSSCVKFDISVIRGLSYYTGIVFEAFDVNRNFRAIFGGGRYDNLLSDVGGKPATGVGLGFGDVVIAEILKDMNISADGYIRPRLAIGYMERDQHITSLSIARSLRNKGSNVDISLSPEKPKNFFSRVGRNGYAEAVFIGPDDVANKSIRIKNLASREERIVSFDDLR